MSDFDYSDFSITVLAQEIDEEQVRVANLEEAINDLPEARDRLAALRAEMLKRVTPEQPQTPSEGEDSTETMVEVVADDTPVIPGKSNLAADYVKHSSFDPGIAALSNGSAEQTE